MSCKECNNLAVDELRVKDYAKFSSRVKIKDTLTIKNDCHRDSKCNEHDALNATGNINVTGDVTIRNCNGESGKLTVLGNATLNNTTINGVLESNNAITLNGIGNCDINDSFNALYIDNSTNSLCSFPTGPIGMGSTGIYFVVGNVPINRTVSPVVPVAVNIDGVQVTPMTAGRFSVTAPLGSYFVSIFTTNIVNSNISGAIASDIINPSAPNPVQVKVLGTSAVIDFPSAQASGVSLFMVLSKFAG